MFLDFPAMRQISVKPFFLLKVIINEQSNNTRKSKEEKLSNIPYKECLR